MDDFERAISVIGNRFDFVLVVSERVRELNRRSRAANEFTEIQQGSKTKKNQSITDAVAEIESGKIGVEYLERISLKGLG